MIKILFLLNLVYFSYQKVCFDDTDFPENKEECFAREGLNENIKCCYLESSYIDNMRGLLTYKDCVTNNEKYEELKEGYEADFRRDGTNMKFNFVCDEDKDNGSYIKIRFLLILDLVIFLFII